MAQQPPPQPASQPDPIDSGLSQIARLVAECLERVDLEGSEAVDAVCAEYPQHAEELRRRLASLRELGLLSQGRFGPYRLIRTLGPGGMGLVYLAHDERLERDVALKALPSRMALNPRALKRFEREVKAAAKLQHPRIVPIYDVGEVDGVPYFTMEYVEGRTLGDVIAALDKLDLPTERLSAEHLVEATLGASAERPVAWGESYVETVCRLVLDVTAALEHAHEHGIVHRDVKPSNIIVRRDGRAQLFDFGLARVELENSMTQTGDFTGTPFYVSPEQIQAKAQPLDRRSDVYSLGVTLYELLTLERPFTGSTTQDVFRHILGREPTLPRKLNPMIPRDLETICLTAIEKDPLKRYQSAAEFAADLRRFLNFEPVKARPVGAATRLLRLARRNRAASLAVALGVLLIVGTPLGLWQANVAIRTERDEVERQRVLADQEAERARAASVTAEHERARAEEQRRVAAQHARDAEDQRVLAVAEARKVTVINQLLLDMLASPGPQFDGREVTVVQVLARFADRIGAELSLAPELEVAARATIGNTYIGLGLYHEAREQLLVARDVAQVYADKPESLVTQDALAGVMLALGVSSMRLGNFDDAEKECQRALDIWRAEAVGPDARVAGALNDLAFIAASKGDIAGAERILEEVLAIRREVYDGDHREVAETLSNLGMMISDRGSNALAEEHYRESLAIQNRVLPSADRLTVTTLSSLALLLGNQGRHAEALEVYGDALELARSLGDPLQRNVAEIHGGLAAIRRDQGEWAGVEEQLRQAVAIYRRVNPGGSSKFAAVLHQLGEAQLQLDRAADATRTLAEALNMARGVAGDANSLVVEILDTFVAVQRRLGRYEKAEQLLLEFEARYASLGPGAASSWAATVSMLRELAEAAGWDDRASTYQQMLDDASDGAGS